MDHSLAPTPQVVQRGPFRLIDWQVDGERTADLEIGRLALGATTSSVYAERKVFIALFGRVVWVTWR